MKSWRDAIQNVGSPLGLSTGEVQDQLQSQSTSILGVFGI